MTDVISMHGDVISMHHRQKVDEHCKTIFTIVRITCIKKDGGNHADPHEGITDFGWVNEQTRATSRSTRDQMVSFLERQGGQAYVKDKFGNIAYISVVTTAWGTKYLRTHTDGKWTDNLLSLPECVG